MNVNPMTGYQTPTLETERLWFRELRLSDAQDMFALDSDPDVVRYAGDAPLTHIDQARERIEGIQQQYRALGLGRWAAIRKDTQEFMGWAGLMYIQAINGRTDVYDLGYRFLPKHWGQGFATEAASAFITHGFDVMHLQRISAYADVRHTASRHVLEKCGLALTNTFMDDGDVCAWYVIDHATWTRNRNP
ncbi:GNAT family N-acetyltransferase [Rhodoferax aquaticus]|nr:GNAT family N-acetyltransferase [Rhodoferax aquaticus]